jgi:succinyl-CoA synthetase beta subunit
MNIHEFQARQLLAQYGVAMPAGEVCDSPEAAQQAAAKLLAQGCNRLVIKRKFTRADAARGSSRAAFRAA